MEALKIYGLLIAMCVSLFCEGQKYKTDWEEHGLKGNVKSVQTLFHCPNEDSANCSKRFPFRLNSDHYNEKGNLTSYAHYKINEKLWDSTVVTYTYHTNNSINERRFSYTRSPDIKIFRFDDNGFKIEEDRLRLDSSKNTVRIFENKLNEKGLLIEQSVHGLNQTKVSRTIYKYDENNNKAEEIGYSPDSVITWHETFKRDPKGNILEYELETGKYKSRSSWIYDGNNNRIKHVYYNKKGKVGAKTDIQYVYDQHNNWIKQTILTKGEKKPSIITRIIEYY